MRKDQGDMGSSRDAYEDLREQIAALNRRVDQLARLMDFNPQVQWFADASGQAIEYNRRWFEWTGLSRDDDPAGRWRQVVHPDDLALVEAAWAHCQRTGEPYDQQHRMRVANGDYRWVRSRAVAHRNEAGVIEGWYGWVEDIDDLKRALQSAEEAWSAVDAVYETAPVGLCVLTPDLRFVRVNERLAEINGVPAKDHIGRFVRDLLPSLSSLSEDIRDQIVATGEAVEGIEFTGETVSNPGVQRTWEENWKPVKDAAGRVVAINVAAREVTTERELARSVAASEEKFRAIADNSPCVIYVADVIGHRLEYLSPAYEAIWGEPVAAIMNDMDHWVETVHPDDRVRTAQARDQLHSAGTLAHANYRIVRPGGEVRHIRDVAVPVKDEDGRVVRVIGVADDVTDERRLDEQRALGAQELVHRMKNMTAAMLAVARLTIRRKLPAGAFEDFERRMLALGEAQRILHDPAGAADLQEIIQRTVSPFAGEERSLRLSGPAVNLPRQVASPLCMALHELATNAIKYGSLSAPGGVVNIEWSHAQDTLGVRWRETGGPPVDEPAKAGFGTRMIEQNVRSELHGCVRVSYGRDGLECVIEIPLQAPDNSEHMGGNLRDAREAVI